jgi:TonB family protein
MRWLMRTISKYLLFAIWAVGLISCASTSRKLDTDQSIKAPFEQVEQAPILIKEVKPAYPPDAFAMRITGTVWVRILIDTLGVVQQAEVLRDAGENVTFFERSSLEAAMHTLWKPAIENGKPIATWITYKVDFNLK